MRQRRTSLLDAVAADADGLPVNHDNRADRHLVALKETGEERVSSEVRVLDRAGRVEEIVRMLGTDSQESRRLAGELVASEAAG